MSSNKMKSSHKATVELAEYWNKKFLEANFMSINTYNDWYTKNGVCSPVYYTDQNKWKKILPILKANISSYQYQLKKNII